ncbi:hypothetical protein [Pseudopedobacter beijingensis]|uniref:Lipocalin-like domain-containing protein n=1 Tax=Pseudopedobacter beijingensis TaxID=1207056 RepID=A0ABW4ICL0_9SPHI
MKKIYLSLSVLSLVSCIEKNKESLYQKEIIGTWKLISGMTIEKGDTTFVDYTNHQKGIKMINTTHFSFLNHDLNKGKSENPIFTVGGGTYSLEGNMYTENLEYCNYRDWEGNSFSFEIAIKNDTLIQQGVEKISDLGINRVNIERYVKISKQ